MGYTCNNHPAFSQELWGFAQQLAAPDLVTDSRCEFQLVFSDWTS